MISTRPSTTALFLRVVRAREKGSGQVNIVLAFACRFGGKLEKLVTLFFAKAREADQHGHRGLVWFFPLAPVAFAGVVLLQRTRRWIGTVLLVALPAHVAVYVTFEDVHGGQCLGPRYLLTAAYVAHLRLDF